MSIKGNSPNQDCCTHLEKPVNVEDNPLKRLPKPARMSTRFSTGSSETGSHLRPSCFERTASFLVLPIRRIEK